MTQNKKIDLLPYHTSMGQASVGAIATALLLYMKHYVPGILIGAYTDFGVVKCARMQGRLDRLEQTVLDLTEKPE
jgi:hypothetical protein